MRRPDIARANESIKAFTVFSAAAEGCLFGLWTSLNSFISGIISDKKTKKKIIVITHRFTSENISYSFGWFIWLDYTQ